MSEWRSPPTPVRSPLAALSQAPQAQPIARKANDRMSIRLNDAPMDFDYESPARGRHSSWLQAAETSKSGMDRINIEDAMQTDTSMHAASGVPLSPTIEGPDVEMETSMRAADGEQDRDSHEMSQRDASSNLSGSRARMSPGPLVRTSKTKQHTSGQQRSFSLSSLLGRKQSSRSRRRRQRHNRHDDDDADYEWEDEAGQDEDETHKGLGPVRGHKRASSLRRRMGNTLNNYYFFGNGHKDVQESQGGSRAMHMAPPPSQPPRWTDPEWCLGMAQFIFNATLLLGVAYILLSIARTLQRDVADKVREYELEFLAEIESCSQSYHLNKCGTQYAVPALAAACAQWQRCSAKDPAIVGRSRVAAETVAEIVNGFVDVVSWKSMAFTLLFVIILVGATNSTLSFFRLRSRHDKDLRPRSHYQAYAGHSNSKTLPLEEHDTHGRYAHAPSLPYNLRSRGVRTSPNSKR